MIIKIFSKFTGGFMKLSFYFLFFAVFFSHVSHADDKRVSSTLVDTCNGPNEEIIRLPNLNYICSCKEGFIRGNNNTCELGQCDPGYKRATTGYCTYTKCRPFDALTGTKCIGDTSSPAEDTESLEDIYEYCDYLTTRITQSNPEKIKKAQATSVNKCPDDLLRFNHSGEAKGGCGIVDTRCVADVRCTPKRIGSDRMGVSLPSSEFNVTCSTVNGMCPPNAIDCVKNDDLTVSPSPMPSTDDVPNFEETLRDVMRDATKGMR